ncbi:MAG: M20/M25/M40 family metallo-hydrolase [Candidatus Eisenbacteria bacterium]|nr:M20/M25/M40 family metallo-hydrolase [Candidatus Eisenbacteria bacterium]
MWRKRTGRSHSATGGPSRKRRAIFAATLLLALFPAGAMGGGGADPPLPAGGPPGREEWIRALRSAPKRSITPSRRAPAPGDTLLASIAGEIHADSLRRTVADLVAFGTRYEYAAEQESAAAYLYDRFRALGLDPYYEPYELSEWDAVDADWLSGGSVGWMIWSDSRQGDRSVILATGNGGASWTAEATVPALLRSIAATPGETWAVGDSGIVLRRGSSAWTVADTLGDAPLVSVDFADDRHGVAVNGEGWVWLTDDGGSVWSGERITTSLLKGAVRVDSAHTWVYGGMGKIWRLRPEGWVLDALPIRKTIYDLAFADTSFAVGAVSGPWLLLWDGAAWDTLSTGVPYGFSVGVKGDSTVWLGGLDSPVRLTRVIRSSDRGRTWEEVLFPIGVLWRSVNHIHFGPEDTVLLAGYDGLSLRSEDGGDSWVFPPLAPSIAHPSRNVAAQIPGRVRPDSVVILSGHYDSIVYDTSFDPYASAPGADDDATGVAAVLEAARAFAGRDFAYTVRFVLFSGEELGLLGSTAYASALAEADEAIRAAVQIDMIGIPGRPSHLYANEASAWILDEGAAAASVAAPDLDLSYDISPCMVYSDHASFWQRGYPAAMLGETIEEDNPLHTPGDTLGNLDFAFTEENARFAAALTARLAGVYTPPDPDLVDALPVRPNPAGGAVTIPFARPAGGGTVSVAIYDVSGRLVRALGAGEIAARGDILEAVWDGRGASGRETAAGVYFARIEAGGRKTSKKIVRLR